MNSPLEQSTLHILRKLESATGVKFENIDLAIDVLNESLGTKKSEFVIVDETITSDTSSPFFYVEFNMVDEVSFLNRNDWTYTSKRYDSKEECETALNNFVSLYNKG